MPPVALGSSTVPTPVPTVQLWSATEASAGAALTVKVKLTGCETSSAVLAGVPLSSVAVYTSVAAAAAAGGVPVILRVVALKASQVGLAAPDGPSSL